MANKITLTANDGSIVEFYDEIKAQGGVKVGLRMFILVLTKPMLSLSIASQSMLMTESVSPILLVSIASGFSILQRGIIGKICLHGLQKW